ncbi:MAG: LysM peptidoglycan-binding domain-containing protein [Chloroflexota bacterium]
MRRWLPFQIMLAVVIALVLLSLQMVFAQTDPTAQPAGQTVQLKSTDTLLALAASFNKPVACLQRANKMDPTNFSLAGLTSIFIPTDCNALSSSFSALTPTIAVTPTAESAESLTTATFTPIATSGTVQPTATFTPSPTSTPTVVPTVVDNQTYTVVYGDRLTKIAEKFGLTIACIANANSISNPDLIYVGQQLRIDPNCTGGSGGGAVSSTPNSSPVVNPKACQFDRNPGRIAPNGKYTVQAGDSLDFIACDFGIELKCLKDSNPQLGGVSLLMPGETLNINLSCPIWRDSTLPTRP